MCKACPCHQPALPASHTHPAVPGTPCPSPPRAEALTGPLCTPAESSRSRAPALPCPPTLAPAFPLHNWRRPGRVSGAETATTGWGRPAAPWLPWEGPRTPARGSCPRLPGRSRGRSRRTNRSGGTGAGLRRRRPQFPEQGQVGAAGRARLTPHSTSLQGLYFGES